MVNVDLLDDGVLWLINRVVFHPRGFALAYDSEARELKLMGAGTDPWSYAGGETSKLAAVEALFNLARSANAS